MKTVNIVLIGAVGERVVEQITAIDPSVRVIDARGQFEVEYAETWPTETVHRYVPQSQIARSTMIRAERDALLAQAEIICIRFPFPLPTSLFPRCYGIPLTRRANRASSKAFLAV